LKVVGRAGIGVLVSFLLPAESPPGDAFLSKVLR
jgi:hypothetical protein